jgi:hypothetical protein
MGISTGYRCREKSSWSGRKKSGKNSFPELKPRVTWFGYSLGAWTAEDEAEVALCGDVTGEKAKNHRVKS